MSKYKKLHYEVSLGAKLLQSRGEGTSMTKESRYTLQDLVATEIARIYSNELNKPFMVMVGDFGGYDIASLDDTMRIELKVETTPIRTGAVAIEYYNTDFQHVSGILGTKADTWLHVVLEPEGLIAYEYDIATLRKLVIEEGVSKRSARNAICRIIPLSVFKKYARRLFPIESRFTEEIKRLGGITPVSQKVEAVLKVKQPEPVVTLS
jgi:hypothetical protein